MIRLPVLPVAPNTRIFFLLGEIVVLIIFFDQNYQYIIQLNRTKPTSLLRFYLREIFDDFTGLFFKFEGRKACEFFKYPYKVRLVRIIVFVSDVGEFVVSVTPHLI